MDLKSIAVYQGVKKSTRTVSTKIQIPNSSANAKANSEIFKS